MTKYGKGIIRLVFNDTPIGEVVDRFEPSQKIILPKTSEKQMSTRKTKSTKSSTPGVCKQEPPEDCKTLGELVNFFIANVRDDLENERREYRRVGRAVKGHELGELVAYRRTDGKVHGHQCRIKVEAKKAAASKFVQRLQFSTFDELLEYVKGQYTGIKGLGLLAEYDAARRYGLMSDTKLVPKSIYLHSGAFDGAKALGLPVRGRRSIKKRELRPDLQRLLKPLTEDELEVFFCIYKGRLGEISIED